VSSHLNHGIAVEVFVCNKCCAFGITLCSHFIKILFRTINLMDTESVGTCGMDGLFVDTECQITVCLGLVVLVIIW
jgi:hypothetical protein